VADFFLRVTRVRLAIVILIVLGALFIDGYSLFYRYAVVHQPFPHKLTSIPTIGGHPITFVKGLDLVGGTELVVEHIEKHWRPHPCGAGLRGAVNARRQ